MANTADQQSLLNLCRKTKVILYCIGPFRLHGEHVVPACVEFGCDHLDICGEPGFTETIEAHHGEKAVEAGSLVVTGCGFYSVPAELGFMFNSRQWVGSMVVNRTESYLSLESDRKIVWNFGTYEAAICGLANMDKLIALRRSMPRQASPEIPSPARKGSIIEYQKKVRLWAANLPSIDSIAVQRTLTHLTQNPTGLPGISESLEHIKRRETFWSAVKPAHFGVKTSFKSLLGIFRYITGGMFIGLLG